jgi:hypothetical protein
MMFDPNNCPVEALAWLGQFVGVPLENRSVLEADAPYYARQRSRIAAHIGFSRGTPAAMRAVLAPLLTGNQTVFFKERDGDPYTLTVVTRTSETPDAVAARRALLTQKPAGIILNYTTANTRTFAETTATGNTFAASLAAWPTFNARTGV